MLRYCLAFLWFCNIFCDNLAAAELPAAPPSPAAAEVGALPVTTAAEWNHQGYQLHRAQRFAEAQTAYQRAIDLDPQFAVAYNNLGAACLGTGDLAGGEAAFRTALQLKPDYVKAAYNLAVTLYRQDRYVDAYRAYRHAKGIDADYVRQRLDKARAREDLQKKLANDPRNELLLLALKQLDDE